MRKAFTQIDTDGSGAIERGEFEAVLRSIAPGATDELITGVYDMFDQSGTGTISSKDFMDSLLDFGGGAAAPPPSSHARGGGGGGGGSMGDSGGSGGVVGGVARSPRARQSPHQMAIEESAEYIELDGEEATDLDVLLELASRLDAEGVPIHVLFRVLCPGGSKGVMGLEGLRKVITKMGLGFTLASAAEENRASKDATSLKEATVAAKDEGLKLGDGVGFEVSVWV